MTRWRRCGLVLAMAGMIGMSFAWSASSAGAATPQGGGVVLDGWGGIHPFGGFTLQATGAAYWPGWDIARALVVRQDGSGGWTLDGWGAIHQFGSAPYIASPTYTAGQNSAYDMVVTSKDAGGEPDGAKGYVLTRDGVIHPWGGNPSISGPTWPGQDIARGLLMHFAGDNVTPDGAWVLLKDGTIVNEGAAPLLSMDPRVPPVWQHLHRNSDNSVWALADWGVTASVTGLPATSGWAGLPDWGGWNILRDVQVSGAGTQSQPPLSQGAISAYRSMYRAPGGTMLDGYGGLHTFGGLTLNLWGAPYWNGWDIARGVLTREDGSGGWTLDGWGGIHPFGSAAAIGAGSAYWPGWDIARGFVLTSHDAHGNLDGRQGYTLDGWGAVHPFGGAPGLPPGAYWPGWDIARGLDIHLDGSGTPDGYAVLDAWGGLHRSGNYPAVASSPPYYPGHDAYQKLDRTDDGQLYAVTHFGRAVALGSQDVSTAPWPSAALSPYWNGYFDYGVWDIVRDVALSRTDNGAPAAQPMSLAATDLLADRTTDLWGRYLNAPALRQSMPLDCESASTAAALNTIGVGASQEWVYSDLPVDARAAIMANGVPWQWGDAWTSFVGNVWGSEAGFTGYGVYYQPIIKVINDAGHPAVGGQHWRIDDMLAEIDRGHPVVIWISNTYHYASTSDWWGWDGALVPYTTSDHTVLLYGVDPSHYSISLMDVWTGTYRSFGIDQFRDFMATWADMAVAIVG